MCERKAASSSIDLPRFFWDTSKDWKGYLFYQLKLANKLVKEYDSATIVRALTELKHVFSLTNKKFLDLLDGIKDEVRGEPEEVVQPLENVSVSGVSVLRRKGLLGKLDE